MQKDAKVNDIFQMIRDYAQISAILIDVKLSDKDIESVIFEIIDRTDPFYITFPDEDKGFSGHLTQMVYSAVLHLAQSKAVSAPNDGARYAEWRGFKTACDYAAGLAEMKHFSISRPEICERVGIILAGLAEDDAAPERCGDTLASDIHWQLNNMFDFDAFYQLVRDFAAAARLRLSDDEFIALCDELDQSVKGDNPTDGPTYRWPPAAAYPELIQSRIRTLPANPTIADLRGIVLAPGIATPIEAAEIKKLQDNFVQIGSRCELACLFGEA
jgi:hypothetical protein